MGNFAANWEDEENNRRVELSINYSIDNGEVSINDVTPKKIVFVDQSHRTIGIHTEKGRALLADQFLKSGKVGQILDNADIPTTV